MVEDCHAELTSFCTKLVNPSPLVPDRCKVMQSTGRTLSSKDSFPPRINKESF